MDTLNVGDKIIFYNTVYYYLYEIYSVWTENRFQCKLLDTTAKYPQEYDKFYFIYISQQKDDQWMYIKYNKELWMKYKLDAF